MTDLTLCFGYGDRYGSRRSRSTGTSQLRLPVIPLLEAAATGDAPHGRIRSRRLAGLLEATSTYDPCTLEMTRWPISRVRRSWTCTIPSGITALDPIASGLRGQMLLFVRHIRPGKTRSLRRVNGRHETLNAWCREATLCCPAVDILLRADQCYE